jgi:hypothetical protein
MTDIRKLINQLAAAENQLQQTEFLAPCVSGGRVCTRVSGIVYSFLIQPSNFEGWGIFKAKNEKEAELVETADLFQIDAYLDRLAPMRLHLAYPLTRRTWLAYPANESDARQRIGSAKPVPIYLVDEGDRFETIVARWDGARFWFEAIDRRADPIFCETLRENLTQLTAPKNLKFKGMTPEMRTVYDLVTQKTPEFDEHWQRRRDEGRLREALRVGGGELIRFEDRHEDFWTVEWLTGDGERHTSAIAKSDLTVVSSGICLSGRDRDFDLHSLVGVIEYRD